MSDSILSRRQSLKALLGLAAVGLGVGTLMTPNAAEAAPLETPKVPDFAPESELPASEPTRVVLVRRRPARRVIVRRPVRRVIVRRRRWR